MGRVKKLLKLQIDNNFSYFKIKDLKTFFKTTFKKVISFAILTTLFAFLFNQIFFFLGITLTPELLGIVIFACQIISLAFSIGNIITFLYLNKDNLLLMVLPVTFNELFFSKIIIVYLNDLFFNIQYILPIMVSIGMLSKVGVLFYINIFLFIFFLPLLPIGIASILSVPISFVVRYFRRHNKVSLIFILVVFAILFIIYMKFVLNISTSFNIADKQIENSIYINSVIFAFGKKLVMFLYLANFILTGTLNYWLLIFIGLSIVSFVICFILIKPFYFRVATMSNENTTANAKFKKFKCRSVMGELILSELRQVFRSGEYIFQYFLFLIFMPLIVFTYDKLLIGIAVNQVGRGMIYASHVLIMMLVALMGSVVSSTSISRMGGCFYIMKSSPVSFYKQVKSRVFFNYILTSISIISTTIISLIFSNISWWVILLSGAIVLLMSLGHICHSFDIDLRSPILDWYDTSEITSIGSNTRKSIGYVVVLSALSFMVILFSSNSVLAGFILLLILSILYAVNRMYLLYIRTKYYFELMEI
ncbi:MAG: hypothetical protein E7345_03640 [Clostridiales bacterium]|nr:hypothetical protein [Clostridiales bacterium]